MMQNQVRVHKISQKNLVTKSSSKLCDYIFSQKCFICTMSWHFTKLGSTEIFDIFLVFTFLVSKHSKCVMEHFKVESAIIFGENAPECPLHHFSEISCNFKWHSFHFVIWSDFQEDSQFTRSTRHCYRVPPYFKSTWNPISCCFVQCSSHFYCDLNRTQKRITSSLWNYWRWFSKNGFMTSVVTVLSMVRIIYFGSKCWKRSANS